MKKIIFLSFLLFTFSFLLFLSVASASFIEDAVREPLGIRAAGMGGAFTAVADDASAIFYNPAGLGDPGSQYQSGVMDNNGAVRDLSAYNVLNLGSIAYGEKRLVSLTNQKAYIYSYAFAQRGNDGINWGLAYKRIQEQSDENSTGSGWAADIGLLFKMTPEANIGILAQNISAGEIDLVPNYRLGGCVKKWDVLWSADAEYQDVAPDRRTYTAMHYGLEKEITSGLALRLGTDDHVGTLGFSVGFPAVIFEYATWATVPQTFRFGFKLGQDKFREGKERNFALFKEKDFVEIDLSGNLISGQNEFSLLGGWQQGADVIREQISLARRDKEVGGLILRIGSFDDNLAMFGTIEEIREELKLFKKEGKKIVAYLETSGEYTGYYLASVADRIVMPPDGSVGLFGISASPLFLGQLMENIGVKWETIYKGKYKTSFHEMNKGVSEDAKALLLNYIKNVNEQVLQEMAKTRKLEDKVVAELRTGKLITATKAKDLKLIDELGYYDDAKDAVQDVAGADKEPPIITSGELQETRGAFDFSYLWPWPNKVAVVDIDGVIVPGKGGRDIFFGGKSVGADDVCEEIDKVADDAQVKVLIVRINSPGGSAIAAAQIYKKLQDIKEDKGKLIVASLGDVAASGGYYIACAADKIVANRATLAGSIGVYSSFPIYYGLLNKLEVNTETLKTGQSVDMFNGLRDLTSEEEKMLSDVMQDTYDRFVISVAKGRKMQIDQVKKLAQGQIFTGAQAKDNGLVDKLGNFSAALDVAKDLADIRGDVRLVRFVRVRDFWQQVGYRIGVTLGLDKGVSSYFRPQLMQYRFVY